MSPRYFRKPTEKEIASVSNPQKYWFVKRYSMWKPYWVPVDLRGMIFYAFIIIASLASFILLPKRVSFSTIGFVIFAIYAIVLIVRKAKAFPAVERVRYNQYEGHKDIFTKTL